MNDFIFKLVCSLSIRTRNKSRWGEGVPTGLVGRLILRQGIKVETLFPNVTDLVRGWLRHRHCLLWEQDKIQCVKAISSRPWSFGSFIFSFGSTDVRFIMKLWLHQAIHKKLWNSINILQKEPLNRKIPGCIREPSYIKSYVCYTT